MQKVANYRRALWLVDEGPTLEQILARCLNLCPDVASTKFEYRQGVDIQIANRCTNGSGVGCYFTIFSEGSPTGTVDNGGASVHRRSAPAGEEFLKTGIYIVVQDDNVGYLANGHTNDGQITGILHKFFERCGEPKASTQFHLTPRADRREIERLLRVGVKSIDLGISAFNSTIEDINNEAAEAQNEQLASLRNGIKEVFSGVAQIVRSGRTYEEIVAASDIQARIHLGYDGRTANKLLPEVLATIGGDIAETDEEFRIVTKHDVIITRDKLVVKHEISVEGDDIALVPASAFSGIRFALQGWRDAGLFEE